MREYRSTLITMLLAGLIEADPPNELTAEQRADGWQMLFDGKSASSWRIEGDHEIVDGTLILGGKRTTRAYLRMNLPRDFELRFQYRTEGTASAGAGWDMRGDTGMPIPGVNVPILLPAADWQETFLEEYAEGWVFPQRVIKYPGGASGVPATRESFWIEVPAGTRLHLRQVRWRQVPSPMPAWLLAIPLVLAVLVVILVWHMRKRRKQATQPWNE